MDHVMLESHIEQSKLNQEPGSSSAAVPAEPGKLQLHESWVCGVTNKLNAPDEIMETLNKFFPWKTFEDVLEAEIACYEALDEEMDPKLYNINKKLSNLKDLAAALKKLHVRNREDCKEYQASYALLFRELLGKVPSIMDVPSYGKLTTNAEKLEILKASVYNEQKDKVQIDISEDCLLEHLEVMRDKILKIDEKCSKSDWIAISASRLHSRVLTMIKALESAVKELSILGDREEELKGTRKRKRDGPVRTSKVHNTRSHVQRISRILRVKNESMQFISGKESL